MWEPFQLSIQEWAPQCKIVNDKGCGYFGTTVQAAG